MKDNTKADATSRLNGHSYEYALGYSNGVTNHNYINPYS
jgi:hypothetical protein